MNQSMNMHCKNRGDLVSNRLWSAQSEWSVQIESECKKQPDPHGPIEILIESLYRFHCFENVISGNQCFSESLRDKHHRFLLEHRHLMMHWLRKERDHLVQVVVAAHSPHDFGRNMAQITRCTAHKVRRRILLEQSQYFRRSISLSPCDVGDGGVEGIRTGMTG